ncbi:MAG: hypothetical protein JXR83_01580 [Deltaproteobacteria bacterium]|nr:hypothetical protein [Deltaproteobacteria bacterium]
MHDQSDVKFDVRRAIVTIALAALKARGHASSDDLLRLRTLLLLNPLFATGSDLEEERLINFADLMTEERGLDSCLPAAAALSPALRETALAITCDALACRGAFEPRVLTIVDRVARALDLAPETVHQILQVTAIRNRGIE